MKRTNFVFLALGLLASSFVFAETADEVYNKSQTLKAPETSQCWIAVDLYNKGKHEEHRDLRQMGRDNNELIETVFDFRSPSSVKDTRIMQAAKANKEDDKWIYLPSLRTCRRIATAERQKSFVGTDYTYNDMDRREPGEDTCDMLEENTSKKVGDKTYNCWKIKATPVKKNLEYAYKHIWIDKETYIPVYQEYYDKKDALLKISSVEKLEIVTAPKTGKKYPMRLINKLENVQTQHSTVITIQKYILDEPISSKYFTQSWLQTGKY